MPKIRICHKSSISEDIVIIKRAFEEMEIGSIETLLVQVVEVIFTPSISDADSEEIVQNLCNQLSESDNRFYQEQHPKILNNIGRIIAGLAFRDQKSMQS